VSATNKLDEWSERSLLYIYGGELPEQIWRYAVELPAGSLELSKVPEDDFSFEDAPGALLNEKSFKKWSKEVIDDLYRNRPLTLFKCKELGRTSKPGQDEVDARSGWSQEIRELRDLEKTKLQQKYADKIKTLETKIHAAQQKLEKQQAQYDKEKWNTLLSIGTTVLGRLLGNKVTAARTVTAGRGAVKAAEKRTGVGQAGETLEMLINEKAELEQQCEQELEEIRSRYSPEGLTLEPVELACRKGDTKVDLLCLIWIPWQVTPQGFPAPLVDLPGF
jgi:hypothetical protein